MEGFEVGVRAIVPILVVLVGMFVKVVEVRVGDHHQKVLGVVYLAEGFVEALLIVRHEPKPIELLSH